jgi:hypothetical protein
VDGMFALPTPPTALDDYVAAVTGKTLVKSTSSNQSTYSPQHHRKRVDACEWYLCLDGGVKSETSSVEDDLVLFLTRLHLLCVRLVWCVQSCANRTAPISRTDSGTGYRTTSLSSSSMRFTTERDVDRERIHQLETAVVSWIKMIKVRFVQPTMIELIHTCGIFRTRYISRHVFYITCTRIYAVAYVGVWVGAIECTCMK